MLDTAFAYLNILHPTDEEKEKTRQAVKTLMKYWREEAGLSVSLKGHIMEQHVCDFNDAIVVYHGNPGGMDEVYSGLAIYENIDEFFSVYSLSGCLFPGSIHSEDEILSMFLKYLVTATTKK